VEQWLAFGEDLPVVDPRVTGTQSPTLPATPFPPPPPPPPATASNEADGSAPTATSKPAPAVSVAVVSRPPQSSGGFGFSSARRAAQAQAASQSAGGLSSIEEGTGESLPSASAVSTQDNRPDALVVHVLERERDRLERGLSPLDLLWCAELESLRAQLNGARIRHSLTATRPPATQVVSAVPSVHRPPMGVLAPTPLGWEWNITRYADLVPASVFASSLLVKAASSQALGAGAALASVPEQSVMDPKKPAPGKTADAGNKKGSKKEVEPAKEASTSAAPAAADNKQAPAPTASAAAAAAATSTAPKRGASSKATKAEEAKAKEAAAAAAAKAAEESFDRPKAELEQWMRWSKSAYLASRAQAWIQLQNACRHELRLV
jgi:hypothetical protein